MFALLQTKSPSLALHSAFAVVDPRANTEANNTERPNFLRNFINFPPFVSLN